MASNSENYPGRKRGITSLVLSIVGVIFAPLTILGIILGFISLFESKRAGVKNEPALLAVILGFIVLAIVILLLFIVFGAIWGFASLIA